MVVNEHTIVWWDCHPWNRWSQTGDGNRLANTAQASSAKLIYLFFLTFRIWIFGSGLGCGFRFFNQDWQLSRVGSQLNKQKIYSKYWHSWNKLIGGVCCTIPITMWWSSYLVKATRKFKLWLNEQACGSRRKIWTVNRHQFLMINFLKNRDDGDYPCREYPSRDWQRGSYLVVQGYSYADDSEAVRVNGDIKQMPFLFCFYQWKKK